MTEKGISDDIRKRIEKADLEARLTREYEKALAYDDAKWDKEIELLEKRAEETKEEVPLEKGGSITIFSTFSAERTERLIPIQHEISKMGPPSKWDADEILKANQLAYALLAEITPNPRLTVEWFEKNKSKFTLNDIETLLLRAVEIQKDVAEKRSKELSKRAEGIKSFRTE